jgi:RNA polymerase sigma-70 factor (ECF subfamily)
METMQGTHGAEVHAVPEDAALAARIRVGDRAAENVLVLRYWRQIYLMAVARLRNCEQAREAADDILMAVVIALRRGCVGDPTRLPAFIHGTAVNLTNNSLRRLRRRPRAAGLLKGQVIPDVAESVDRECDVRRIQLGLAGLTERERQLLKLCLIDGLKPGEIAARLGSSGMVVRQQKRRAIGRLRNLLEESTHQSLRAPFWMK